MLRRWRERIHRADGADVHGVYWIALAKPFVWAMIVLGLVFMIVIAVATTLLISTSHRLEREQRTQQEAQLASCERVNVFRHQAQLASLRQATLISLSLRVRRAQAHYEAGPLRRNTRWYVRRLRALLGATHTTPQVDCARAVAHPLRYRSPRPRAFTRAELRAFARHPLP